MPTAQRSILSFFQSSSSPSPSPSSSNLPSLSSASVSARPIAPAAPLPPPPPPPPLAKFVPPPSSAVAAANGQLRPVPPPGMAMRSGGSTDPKLDLPPITAELATEILTAAGAAASGEDLVFPLPTSYSTSASSSVSSPPPVSIAMPRYCHVADLISVNTILLSVRYPQAFYRPVADRTRVASLFNRVILDGDKVIGGLICRLEPWPFGQTELQQSSSPSSPSSPSTPPLVIYVQSLALLSPYRTNGLAAAALDSLAATAAALNATGRLPPVRALYAHTWTESADVLHWYEARGFARHGSAPIDNYYFALRPSTAWIMRRDLPVAAATAAAAASAASAIGGPTASSSAAAAPPPPPPSTAARPTPTSSLSFQNTRPDMEWNDLPADMMAVPSASASTSASASSSRNVSRSTSRLNLPSSSTTGEDDRPPIGGSAPGSQMGSRSSSAARKKRDRAYPAAMFGQ